MCWISIKKQLPKNGQKVKYRMKKKLSLFKSVLIEDCGVYLNKDFYTIDPKCILPIIDWKPL